MTENMQEIVNDIVDNILTDYEPAEREGANLYDAISEQLCGYFIYERDRIAFVFDYLNSSNYYNVDELSGMEFGTLELEGYEYVTSAVVNAIAAA